MVGSLGIAFILGIVLLGVFMPSEGVDWRDAAWNAAWRVAFLGAFVFLTIYYLGSSDGRRSMAGLAALLVLGADLIFHAPALAPTVPASVYLNPVPRSIAFNDGESRVAISPSLEKALILSREGDLALDLTRKRDTYLANFNLLEGVPAVSGFMTMKLPFSRRGFHRPKRAGGGG